VSVSKPMLGLTLGGALGLLDGLSGFFEPSLAPLMTSVITFSLLKGLVSGVAIGYLARKIQSMLLGILGGLIIAAFFSFLLVLKSGMALFWDIMLPGMLLGLIVGFATQRFGARDSSVRSTQSISVSPGQLQK
jgi:MFS-type transporter involved in bile tolerance (Atg22 family)